MSIGDTSLFHAYGWRGVKGPYFLHPATTPAEAIRLAEQALSTRRFTRVYVQDMRTHEIVWASEE